MFDRLYSEHNLAYRCFISILALCGAINTNIAERKEGNAEYERMQKFFSDALSTLENQKKKFLRYYLLAVKVWMDVVAPTEAEALEIRRDMSRESAERKTCLDSRCTLRWKSWPFCSRSKNDGETNPSTRSEVHNHPDAASEDL